ncbi:hypothetical protein [uncultured Jannaschia sp.]|uniref:hypothetical protein n=1 Tax=uncultured Jannaschia sp. TaxID=293347 RepID=UPI0026214664|nr:hypothetical protein [uncultured Jannaschia sp.]
MKNPSGSSFDRARFDEELSVETAAPRTADGANLRLTKIAGAITGEPQARVGEIEPTCVVLACSA